MVPAERPATVPTIDSLNPTLGIMGVIQAVNEEAREEVNTLAPVVDDSERAFVA